MVCSYDLACRVVRCGSVTNRKIRVFLFALCVCFLTNCMQGCKSATSSQSTAPVVQAVLTIDTTILPAATVGVSYSSALVASGGSGTGESWTTSSGALPTGLSLSSGGIITGVPTTAGTVAFSVKVTDSAGNSAASGLSMTIAAESPLTTYDLKGNTSPVHDPSIIREGSTYYVFATDALPQSGFIPIRCSNDKVTWNACGSVFSSLPPWIASAVPAAKGIWAPDISYFNGSYHLYYAVSTFGTNVSAIGLATNVTLDSSSPVYQWVDQGMVLQSTSSSNFNAIDPNVLVDSDGAVWLNYGSFWNGIFQQQIDVSTGKLQTGNTVYHLAQRAANVTYDPIEGASLIHKDSYYYLFVSWDFCCNANPALSTYKIVVGRSASAHGPFLDQAGVDMASGGGTVLLQGDGVSWSGPGGQTAYVDPAMGDLIVFHALNLAQQGLDYLFVRSLSFGTGWPVIGSSSVSSTGPLAVSTSTTLTTSAPSVTAGSAITFQAKVIASSGGIPAGTVNFYADSNLLGGATLDGSGTGSFTTTSLAVGVYTLTGVYVGNSSDASSTSSGVNLTVQMPSAPTATSTALTVGSVSSMQGVPLSLYAAVTPVAGTAVATGVVTFLEGSATLGTGVLDVSGRADLTTLKLLPGTHQIVASYGGDQSSQASTSNSLMITITQPSVSTFTNPLTLTDPILGSVTSCPDPAIIKSQVSGVDTWYLYCTGDAHNGSDLIGSATLNNRHGLSVYHSSDLVHWNYDRDAFSTLPVWASPDALMWAPAIKYFNGKYYLYYTVTATTYPGGASAIGVGTSASADGPFIDSGTAVVQPETVAAGMDSSGLYRWLFDPDVIADSNGQRYILFGSFIGGISIRTLSSDGLISDPSSERLIAADSRYEGAAWMQHGSYYYLFVSATNCCAGPLTGYGVFTGRSTTPLGPYLDEQGRSLSDSGVGGTPVLSMNGNSLLGPGGGNPFTDESGQDYYLYHTVTAAAPYYSGFAGTTQRPVAMNALDWVNGWPLVRGGYGPSDAVSPQPMPAAQPGAANSYTTIVQANDAPLRAINALSEDFNGALLGPQWKAIHSMPVYTLTGTSLKIPTVNFDTTNAMSNVPILAEYAPMGDYLVETSVEMDMSTSGTGYNYAQAGLLLYRDDQNYLRVDLYANSDTRQIEFVKAETAPAANYPTWGATDLGPAALMAGHEKAWIRVAKRTVDGSDVYTCYSSIDGTTWLRAGSWTHRLGNNVSIGLYGGNRAGYDAMFDYIHVSTLK